jgi:putative nucleotidyltransferase with HDIG domain
MTENVGILLVEDEVKILEVYSTMLADKGYSVATAQCTEDALRLASLNKYDIAFVDQYLGSSRGLDLMQRLKEITPDLSVVMMTGNGSTDFAIDALKQGAVDFIVKPFLLKDLLSSIDYSQKKRCVELSKRKFLSGLEQAMNEKTEELKRIYTHVLSSLTHAMEQRDPGTYGHSHRVSHTACLIAAALNFSDQERADLKTAALLHDIGKIGITDFILGKEGPLTEKERAVIRSHTYKGVEILKPLQQYQPILPSILHHHERYDGTGYPSGLAGEQIPLHARIISIADTYDAIISTRPYRKGNSHKEALDELKLFSGTQFDPRIVKAFMSVTAPGEDVLTAAFELPDPEASTGPAT